jgi:hypothetical protein
MLLPQVITYREHYQISVPVFGIFVRDQRTPDWGSDQACYSNDAVERSNASSKVAVRCYLSDCRCRKGIYVAGSETVDTHEKDKTANTIAEEPQEETQETGKEAHWPEKIEPTDAIG